MIREELQELLRPIVEDLGYELWELEFAPRSGGGLLRLYIDAQSGISLDDCARVSRAVSGVLDSEDPIPGAYTLEVSSPGLDRVLRTREHFARCVGEQVKIEMAAPLEGRRRFAGRLEQVLADEIEVRLDDRIVRLPIDGVAKARVVPEF
jgi:ribosome maturation factor RimP